MKPYEFITMLCAFVVTGITIVNMVGGDIERIEKNVAALTTDMAEIKDDVAVLKDDVAVLKDDVAVLKTDVAVLKTDMAGLMVTVAEHGQTLEILTRLRGGPFLTLNPAGEDEFTYFQPWAPGAPETTQTDAAWAQLLGALKDNGYKIETVKPSVVVP